jgi:kojibiose phosphorylase
VVTVFTSGDGTSVQAAQDKLAALSSYALLIEAHQRAWNRLAAQRYRKVEGDRTAQLSVRCNLFQLIIASASANNDRGVSVIAKRTIGFGCQSIFFGAQKFSIFFAFTQPAISASAYYRYHTLGAIAKLPIAATRQCFPGKVPPLAMR